jgi:hypothetical protein
MIKKTRLLEMLVDFAEVWPREITPKLVDIYWTTIKAAKTTEAENIEEAFKHILATNKYKFPDPSAFIEALGGSQIPTRNQMREFLPGDDSFLNNPAR